MTDTDSCTRSKTHTRAHAHNTELTVTPEVRVRSQREVVDDGEREHVLQSCDGERVNEKHALEDGERQHVCKEVESFCVFCLS